MQRQASGTWKTVCLSRCREKISQRLRENNPVTRQGPLKPSKAMKPLAVATRHAMTTAKPSGQSEVYPTVTPRDIVVTDASSDDDETLFEPDVSCFSVKDEQYDVVDVDSLTVEPFEVDLLTIASFDDSMFESFEAATCLEPLGKHTTLIEIEGVPKLVSKQEEMDDDNSDYSYGTVIECVHDEDSPKAGLSGDTFPLSNEECDKVLYPKALMVDLDEDEVLLDYFLF